MILDFHTHVFPASLAPKAMDSMSERAKAPYYADGTAEGLLASMERAGVTHSVICNIAVKPGQTEKIVGFATETAGAYSGACPALIPLASVHPLEPESLQWLSRIQEAGFPGIKLHPDYQNFYINDPALEAFYREANRLGLVMVFHMGVDLGYPDSVRATPERVADILPVFEEGKVVLAHLGGYQMQADTLRYLCGRNVYLDTSYNLDKVPIVTLQEMIRSHTPEKILFATDSPWEDQEKFVRYFSTEMARFLSPKDQEAILWNNGAELLGLRG